MVNAYLQQLDIGNAQFTVRCDVPTADNIDTIRTVPTHDLPEALAALSGLCVDTLDVGESPAIIEVRRVQ